VSARVDASTVAGQKKWASARAAVALKGLELLRTDPADGVQRLVAVRGRQAYVIDTLDQLDQVLGAPTVLTT